MASMMLPAYWPPGLRSAYWSASCIRAVPSPRTASPMASTRVCHAPWSYIAAAMPSEAQPSVSRGTALSPVRGNGLSSTEARKVRRPFITASTRVAQGAVALLDAVGRPLPGGALEALGLAEVDLLRGEVGGDDAVEHHPADLLGEEVGVDRAEVGAVRLAEVGELLLAERGPQHVQVASGIPRRHVCEQRAGRAPQDCAKPRACRAKACSSAASSGVGSEPRKASSSASVRQSMGAERPTPRGSNPTTS